MPPRGRAVSDAFRHNIQQRMLALWRDPKWRLQQLERIHAGRPGWRDRRVPCPHCGAATGKACQTLGGRVRRAHTLRQTAARRILDA